jgi:rod shape-determining protein MreD
VIRRLALSCLLVSLLLIIQSTWLDSVAIYSVIPDLSMLAVIYISFKSPGVQGQLTGFIGGLLQDGVSAAPFGLNALIKAIMAFFFNSLSGHLFSDRILMPIVFGVAGTLLKAGLLAILTLLFQGKVPAYDFTKPLIWIEAGYNGAIAPFFFLLIGFLDKFILPVDSKHD